MKTFTTILFVLFFGLLANAQDNTGKKVEAIEMGIVQMTEISISTASVDTAGKQEVARLYRRSDSRVKKALNFTTKKHYQIA
ncbi:MULTISPECIES: hypothetical protein [Robiginitalea]|uniref:Uncharacterized protein n=1 Tax=Robiginitalea biformata (strain ATCC BAA-864 / DSM 15991 / KCTC 12146 / HTCC2501) TaxID=313596 RepID=A4CMS9_ROBBH|nr:MULTISPECIES: hypothetical protein [Robiginitalea]EAR14971.1 hypothetical protein RB2501_11612 [Robiginitalea biformata HTCC2501]MDC6355211.1 hypothetical protein [Robiginitalea sp. PM2]MDC6375574.1 hypothetical protein [Robiginitalea sp. SP8]